MPANARVFARGVKQKLRIIKTYKMNILLDTHKNPHMLVVSASVCDTCTFTHLSCAFCTATATTPPPDFHRNKNKISCVELSRTERCSINIMYKFVPCWGKCAFVVVAIVTGAVMSDIYRYYLH